MVHPADRIIGTEVFWTEIFSGKRCLRILRLLSALDRYICICGSKTERKAALSGQPSVLFSGIPFGAASRNRTGTGIATHGILSPGRLPVPPLRQLMDGGGFEPPKQFAADLQSVPFGHSGNRPYYKMGPIGLEPMTLCL